MARLLIAVGILALGTAGIVSCNTDRSSGGASTMSSPTTSSGAARTNQMETERQRGGNGSGY